MYYFRIVMFRIVEKHLTSIMDAMPTMQMAKEVYRFMERSGLKMNDVSYGCFLRTLCRSGQLDDVCETYE